MRGRINKKNIRDVLIVASITSVLFISAKVDQYKQSQTIEIIPFESISNYEEPLSIEIESVPCEVELLATIQEEPETFSDPIVERIGLGECRVTAYCPCSKCCGKWADGLTYTETVATEGRTIAVDPELIPLGSIVEVNGVEYVAEDIGGAIKGNRLDIFFNSHEDALEWGVQYHDVYLVNKDYFF